MDEYIEITDNDVDGLVESVNELRRANNPGRVAELESENQKAHDDYIKMYQRAVSAEAELAELQSRFTRSEARNAKLRQIVRDKVRYAKYEEAASKEAWYRAGELDKELAELREAAAWYMECNESYILFNSFPLPLVKDKIDRLNIRGNREHEWWATVGESKRALRALLSKM